MAATKKAIETRKRKRAQAVRRDPAVRLLDAVGRYMASRGGSAVVAGPISLIRESHGRNRHSLVIDFMGSVPSTADAIAKDVKL